MLSMGQKAMRRLKGLGRQLRQEGELGEELDLKVRRWRKEVVEQESTDKLNVKT